MPAGKMEESNDRVINQLIVKNVLEEGPCQLQMGLTELKPGSVWNTMPAHTHSRRVEAYFYFNVPEGNMICHLMGEPDGRASAAAFVMVGQRTGCYVSGMVYPCSSRNQQLYVHLGNGRREFRL